MELGADRITSLTLIGVGGISTALLPALVRLRPRHVTLWDDDLISPENLVNQFFWKEADVGRPKAIVAAEWLLAAGVEANAVPDRYRGTPLFDTIVIAAVDSLESRRQIWRGVMSEESRVKLLLDGRLSRETPFFLQLFVISTDDVSAPERYEPWLVGDGEADTGRRNLDMVPAPLVLSGLISTLVVRWSRGDDLPWQIMWDGAGMSLVSFESK
mgnify:CR=1 FL=1